MNELTAIFLPMWPENPYQKLLIEHLQKLGVQVEGIDPGIVFLPTVWKANVLHLHQASYPLRRAQGTLMSWLKVVLFLSQLVILRWVGVKIVWTAHDLKGHESKHLKLDRICTASVARLAHKIIVHGETAKQDVTTALQLSNTEKFCIVPHGNYINYYENKIDRSEARTALGISDQSFVMLFLGQIRPYKGVPELIDAFKQLPYDDIQLVIAGKPLTAEVVETIKQETAGHDNILFKPGFVADDQIQVYMNACDVTILPYRNILTSGSVVLAMSFSKACIAPRQGHLGDVLDDAGAFLYDPDAEAGLLQAMTLAVQRKGDSLRMGEHNRQLAEQWSWSRVAEMTLSVYQQRAIYQTIPKLSKNNL